MVKWRVKMGIFNKHKKKDQEQQCNLSTEKKGMPKKVQTVRKSCRNRCNLKDVQTKSCQKFLNSEVNLSGNPTDIVDQSGSNLTNECLCPNVGSGEKEKNKKSGVIIQVLNNGSVQTKSFKSAIKDYLDEIEAKYPEEMEELSRRSSKKSNVVFNLNTAGDQDILGKFEEFLVQKAGSYGEEDVPDALEGAMSNPSQSPSNSTNKMSNSMSKERKCAKQKSITKPPMQTSSKYRNVPDKKSKRNSTFNSVNIYSEDSSNTSHCRCEEPCTPETPDMVNRNISEELIRRKYKFKT